MRNDTKISRPDKCARGLRSQDLAHIESSGNGSMRGKRESFAFHFNDREN